MNTTFIVQNSTFCEFVRRCKMKTTTDVQENMEVDQNRRLNVLETDFPTDDEIKEVLQKDTAEDYEEDEEDISSDDVEGMTILWDKLICTREPYGNTIEHLKRILEAVPTRIGTRLRQEPERFDQRVHEKKEFERVQKILNALGVEDIDPEIVNENLNRMRNHIRHIIERKCLYVIL